MLPTMWIMHLSCMIATGLDVPDPFSGHVQQEKDREIALLSTAWYLKLENGKCVDKSTISSLSGCVCT